MNFKNRAYAKRQTTCSYVGSINSSAKLIKNKKVSNNYTYVIYLSPADTSGYDVCPFSTPECRGGCLHTSGRVKVETFANMNTIQKARIKKTRLFMEHPEFFMRWVIAEMQSYQKKAAKDGYAFSARLNGTSDIAWENILIDNMNLMEIFPDVQFYDYTKNPARMQKNYLLPENYHLTFSYTGRNEYVSKKLLAQGKNVAVIYNIKKGHSLPAEWNGFEVIDGDLTDYRPLDGEGVVVGLRWKDIADRQKNKTIRESQFVVQV